MLTNRFQYGVTLKSIVVLILCIACPPAKAKQSPPKGSTDKTARCRLPSCPRLIPSSKNSWCLAWRWVPSPQECARTKILSSSSRAVPPCAYSRATPRAPFKNDPARMSVGLANNGAILVENSRKYGVLVCALTAA